ncbi:reverse transcriptase family protein, partial [Flagellimonas marinaquae]
QAIAPTSFYVEESDDLRNATDRISKILDAKYAPADLHEVAQQTPNLTPTERRKLEDLLQQYASLFDGTLGEWKGKPYHIQLRDGVTPYHTKPFSVPKAYELTLRKEIARLCKIGVLRKINHSEWAAPSFIIPKKDGTVRFINDFRELNKRIRRMPYPIPKIQDVLLKLEGFTYATSLDLNMGYYHIRLDLASRKLCTLIFPWGKYEMQALPMGLCNSPDIFQEKMGELMQDLEFVRAYIDDLLVITKSSFDDHLSKLEVVLQRLQQTGLKINARKSFFVREGLEYLGYWISREGIQPLPKKVDAIMRLSRPKTRKELRSFIGLVNYYRDAWIRRSDILAPLAELAGANSKWEWTDVHQNAFDTMKKVVAREVLLAFPDFNKPFEIYTDASKLQLGAVITQGKKPIAFYSRKLNSAQRNYTTTERELLAIVETLREFRNI